MRFWKPYKSLTGYLKRFTILQCGRVHIRIHRILSADKTPFLHTHPFHYVSIIVSGGYWEKINDRIIHHTVGSIICRRATDAHRIVKVSPNTKTLFITWCTDSGWQLSPDNQQPDDWISHTPGIYLRELYGRIRFCKFDQFWHRAHDSLAEALIETNPSIDQTSKGSKFICSLTTGQISVE